MIDEAARRSLEELKKRLLQKTSTAPTLYPAAKPQAPPYDPGRLRVQRTAAALRETSSLFSKITEGDNGIDYSGQGWVPATFGPEDHKFFQIANELRDTSRVAIGF